MSKPGKMKKCYDCGISIKVRPDIVRPLCKKCSKRHHPKKKTYAIIKFYQNKLR